MPHLRETADKALKMLRTLPRVQIGNLRPNPNSKQNVSFLIRQVLHQSFSNKIIKILIIFLKFLG